MSLSDYIQGYPERGEFTGIASFAPAVPAMPSCINRRRLDVFQCYRLLVEKHRETAPIKAYVAHLRDAVLVTAGGGRRASAMGVAGGPSFAELFAQSETAEPLLAGGQAKARFLAGSAAVLTEITAGENYYHWLLTALPKLLLLMYRYSGLAFEHFVVNDASAPFVRETLDFLGVPRERIVSTVDHPALRLEHAYVASLRSELIYPHALVPEMFRAVFPRSVFLGKHLYITRRHSRRIANEQELLPILREFHFEIVDPQELPLAEQIRSFSQAHCVVCAHGAGLSNMIFSPVRTKVLEIFSPRQVNPIYWYLAAACNQEYHYLLSRGEDRPIHENDWRADERSDITVDPDEFRQAIIALHLQPSKIGTTPLARTCYSPAPSGSIGADRPSIPSSDFPAIPCKSP